MDAMFTHDPLIEKLGMDHGPGGPLAVAHLLGVAKLHEADGAFEIHWQALAQAIYVTDMSHVKSIIGDAAALGIFEVTAITDRTLAAKFPGWMSWQWDHKRRNAAERKANQRERDQSVTGGRPRVTQKSHPGCDKNVTTDTDTDTDTDTEEPKGSSNKGEHEDFAAWLAHHEQVTTMHPPRPGTKARAEVAAMYGARRAEGYSAEDLCLATLGAFNDDWRRQNGHYGCVSVLRPKKVHDLVEKGRRGPRVVGVSQHPADVRDRELAAEIERLRAEEANAA